MFSLQRYLKSFEKIKSLLKKLAIYNINFKKNFVF